MISETADEAEAWGHEAPSDEGLVGVSDALVEEYGVGGTADELGHVSTVS